MRRSAARLRSLARVALCLATLPACPSRGPDTELRVTFVLTATPQTLVLRPAERQAVRFELRDDRGAPVPDALVRFALSGALPDLARGATLSASELLTDARGVGELELRAGLPGTFRLRATTAGAEALELPVFVSASSHGDLTVIPALAPGLAGAALTVLLADDDRCQRLGPLDPARPPATARPPQPADPVHGTTFRSLRTDQSHAVIGLARSRAGRVVAQGCIDVPGSQLLDGTTARVALPLEAIAPRLSGRYAVHGTLRLATPPPALLAQRAIWDELGACPLGVAQRWLDCVLDGLGDEDPLDCASPAGEPGPVFAALAARRGVPAPDGCRPAQDPLGRASLDALLHERLARGPTGLVARMPALARAQQAPWRPFALDGTLELARDTSGRWVAHHTLSALRFDPGDPAPAAPVALFELGLPALQARFVPAASNARELTLGSHGFTLRLGAVGRHDFLRRVLRPSGIAEDVTGLVAAIERELRGDDAAPAQVGCDALDTLACGAAGLAPGCVLSACTRAGAAFAARLESAFEQLDGEDRDLVLDGSASLVDLDDDGVVDRLGQAPDGGAAVGLGLWSGTLRTRAGSVDVTGTWSATAAGP